VVPCADMANHSSAPNASYRLDADSGSFQLIANRVRGRRAAKQASTCRVMVKWEGRCRPYTVGHTSVRRSTHGRACLDSLLQRACPTIQTAMIIPTAHVDSVDFLSTTLHPLLAALRLPLHLRVTFVAPRRRRRTSRKARRYASATSAKTPQSPTP
jgi:hypothetical protein